MKRLNPFGYTEFYRVSEITAEGEHPVWMTEWSYEIVDVDDWDSWMSDVKGNLEESEIPEFNKEYHKMRNKDYMEKHVIGNCFDDMSNEFVDQDCPKCEHLMVEQDRYDKENGRFCSNHECDYHDEAHQKHMDEFNKIRKPGPPMIKFREVGQTLEEFCKKYKIQLEKRPVPTCTVCKQEVKPSDWYVTKKYAMVHHGEDHSETCDNNLNPTVIVPLGEEAKKWKNLVFGKE